MSKALIVGVVVVTLVQVVIASNSPILDASMIGGAVLFLVALWDELVRETSSAGAERSSQQRLEPYGKERRKRDNREPSAVARGCGEGQPYWRARP